MTDNEFLAQLKAQAQQLSDEVEALKAIDVHEMVERVFNEVFGVQPSNEQQDME